MLDLGPSAMDALMSWVDYETPLDDNRALAESLLAHLHNAGYVIRQADYIETLERFADLHRKGSS